MRIALAGEDAREEYAGAVRDAGGEPSLLVPDVRAIDGVLRSFDGIVLTGGVDVGRRFGGVPAGPTDDARDAFEIALVRRLRHARLPVLGICRGLQVMNVALGGDLVADLEDDLGIPADAHRPRLADGETDRRLVPGHLVRLEPGRLADALGTQPFVTTSRHHQAIRRLAPELRITGRTADGVVEAVEATFAHPWFAGVQWHPETSAVRQDDAPSRRLFRAFVEACGAEARAVPRGSASS